MTNGCNPRSKVCIPAIVDTNVNFVMLERVKNDAKKNLHDDYDNLMASNYKKNIIDDNTLIYTYQNKSSSESYKNIVIIRLDEHKLKAFFCFWIDYKKKELMYLVAPKKYIKLIDESQWKIQQSDKQIQKKIMSFIDSKGFEPEKLKQQKIFYYNLDRGEFSIPEPVLEN
jgi:hypothetical protein